jgi:hypothetical protein
MKSAPKCTSAGTETTGEKGRGKGRECKEARGAKATKEVFA